MVVELRSFLSLPAVYAFSPFDSTIVDKDTEITAITILAVFGILFLAGFIGHCCVLAFVSCNKSRSRSRSLSAYVIIGNLAAAHLLFAVTCLPAEAYKSAMELVTSEWIFGDIMCRLFPFLRLFLLGVTTLSFFAFAIDRFRSARHVDRGYDSVHDSPFRRVCKMLVLWIGALLLATPELLVMNTSVVAAPVVKNVNSPFISDNALFSQANLHLLTKDSYKIYRDTFEDIDGLAAVRKSRKHLIGSSEVTSLPEELKFDADFYQNTTFYVQYQTCQVATAWDDMFPNIVHIFMTKYVSFRHWWLIVFYFFFPICFALLFALLISRRLAVALQNNSNESSAIFTGSYYVTNGIDGGTLTSQREPEQVALMDNPPYKTNSLLSSHTSMSDILYQQRGGCSIDRQVAHSQKHRRLSPVISTEDLHDASPTVVVSNGSVRTVDSNRRLPELSPQSPFAPSLACASGGVSVLSLAMSLGNGGGTLASLPPHGHRRSIKRNSRSLKQTVANVARERSLNSVLVSLVLAFTLTQLPLRVVAILLSETRVMSMLEKSYAELIIVLCNYLAVSTFIINPIVLCFCYKLYRKFLSYKCCCCC